MVAYRVEAEHCRKMAACAREPEVAKRWLQLAVEYDQLAEVIETEEARTGPTREDPAAA